MTTRRGGQQEFGRFAGLPSRRLVIAAAMLLPAVTRVAATERTTGEVAPDFEVTDSTGARVRLSDFRGKTVVLEWTNPTCPFVKKHYSTGNMQSLQREARAAGVIWLTISSADAGNPGYLEDIEAQALVEQTGSKASAFLLDRKGRMQADYGVSVALSMFVIRPDGAFAYIGAIDDKPTANPKDVAGARNYVREAVLAATAGREPEVRQTRPYGCVAR